ncbi:MAG: glycosyltransferase family 9 protein [Fimbriimonadales bacterium]|nr:glycosyltransferase family 9 protein [Fimbriimonadales bacterium]
MRIGPKILIVRLSALGDIIHTLPTATLLKSSLPEVEIHWLVQENFREVLEGHPAIDKLLTVPRRWKQEGFMRFLKGIRELRRHQYFSAMDMQGLLKSAFWVGIAKAKYKLGYHFQREGSKFFSRAVMPPAEHTHVVDQYRDVAREALHLLGDEGFFSKLPHGEKDEVEFGLSPQPEALRRAREMLKEMDLPHKPLAINLGAGKPRKRYPIPLFAQFIVQARQKGWSPFCVGGAWEQPLYEELRKHCPGEVPSLIGRTSLSDLIGVLSLSEAHVAGDTGSLHIAVALGVPAVALMGPTSPERTGPYGERGVALYKGPDGLGQITPSEVVEALEKVLSCSS